VYVISYFYVVYLGHIFLKSSIVMCYNINKLTYIVQTVLNDTF